VLRTREDYPVNLTRYVQLVLVPGTGRTSAGELRRQLIKKLASTADVRTTVRTCTVGGQI
jgi:hypothetical protein